MWSNLARWQRIIVIVAVVLFAWFIWPSPYFYEHCAGGTIVRVNRITGSVKVIYRSPGPARKPFSLKLDTSL